MTWSVYSLLQIQMLVVPLEAAVDASMTLLRIQFVINSLLAELICNAKKILLTILLVKDSLGTSD